MQKYKQNILCFSLISKPSKKTHTFLADMSVKGGGGGKTIFR